MPISFIDSSCIRLIISFHFSGLCATGPGALRNEPTLYSAIALWSFASSSWNSPFTISPNTSMASSVICPILASRSIFDRSSSTCCSIFASSGMAVGTACLEQAVIAMDADIKIIFLSFIMIYFLSSVVYPICHSLFHGY